MQQGEAVVPLVCAFIDTRITQYVSDVMHSRKFPGVNVPNCNPVLDVLVYCIVTHPNRTTIRELSERPTFSQLALDEEMQEVALEGNGEPGRLTVYADADFAGAKDLKYGFDR